MTSAAEEGDRAEAQKSRSPHEGNGGAQAETREDKTAVWEDPGATSTGKVPRPRTVMAGRHEALTVDTPPDHITPHAARPARPLQPGSPAHTPGPPSAPHRTAGASSPSLHLTATLPLDQETHETSLEHPAVSGSEEMLGHPREGGASQRHRRQRPRRDNPSKEVSPVVVGYGPDHRGSVLAQIHARVDGEANKTGQSAKAKRCPTMDVASPPRGGGEPRHWDVGGTR